LTSFWLPAPRPADAPAQEFSAARALEHVRAVAQRPHPTTSEDNRRVRAYLADALRNLGLDVEVQEGTEAKTRLFNLYTELPGHQPGHPRALLVTHHDSVGHGPGAADAGSGVATLLEVLRALKAAGPRRNSLGFLFTDGEEAGLLGARLFVRTQTNRLAALELIVNLEARGNHGPVVMFQTGPGSLALVRDFAAALPYPVAASFSQDVYERLPNDTDFTVFLRAGKRGYNFGFVGGLEFYHTLQDTPENLSRRTLQHYGDCVLPIARRLAQAEDADWVRWANSAEAVYGSPWRGALFVYPAAWVPGLTGLITAAYLGALGRGLARGRLRPWPVLRAALATLATVAAIALLGAIALAGWNRLPSATAAEVPAFGLPAPTAMLALLLLLAVWLACRIAARLDRSATPAEALAGGLAWWILLGIGSACTVRGATFLAHIPALAGVAALGLLTTRNITSGWLRIGHCALTCLPAPLLFAPVIGLLYQTLTFGATPLFLALAALVSALLPRFGHGELRHADRPGVLPGRRASRIHLVPGPLYVAPQPRDPRGALAQEPQEGPAPGLGSTPRAVG
jgi:hypothetical protein